MMKYKGYQGKVAYDDEAKLFHGEIIGTRSVITFQGKTVDEIEQAFKDSVDIYIEWCQARNIKPEKPFSGNLHIRISPDVHAKLAQEAASNNMSLNAFVTQKLTK